MSLDPGREKELETLVSINNVSPTFTCKRIGDSIKPCFFSSVIALCEISLGIILTISGGKTKIMCL